MGDFDKARDFVERIRSDDYLKPDASREQREKSLFLQEVSEKKHDDMSGRLYGEVKPWDINLRYAMDEESEEQVDIKQRVAAQMGFKTLESGLDSTFFEKREECLAWWEQQSYDIKRRCLERVITLLGVAKVSTEAVRRYKDIADGNAWQNHHALKEACDIIEKLIVPLDSGVAGAETVVLRLDNERMSRELEKKKSLIKKKNREIKMLRERQVTLLRQLGIDQ